MHDLDYPSHSNFFPAVKKTLPLALSPLAILLLAGCASDETPHPMGRAVIKTPGEMNVYDVADNDAQMDRATREARKTVPQFVQAFQHPAPGDRNFAVKKLFVKDGKAEHIWLTDIQFTGNRFQGLVDNKPVHVAGLKLGDRVSVNPNEVSDWMYVHDNKLVGGYTLRVLYTELSPAEKDDFRKRAGFDVQ
jgi:uncharacterized protein YegJ (DUF2314 family)